jgi:hypothetical protein
MGLFGMRLPHLLEGGKQIIQVLGLCCIAKNLFEGFTVRMFLGRQPERGAAEVGRYAGSLMFETAPRELTSGGTHRTKVFVWRWPRESRDRVSEKRRNYRCDGVRHLIGCRTSYLDRRTDHLGIEELQRSVTEQYSRAPPASKRIQPAPSFPARRRRKSSRLG